MFVDGFPVAAHFNLQYFFAIEDLEYLRSLPNITNAQYLHFPALR